MTVGSLRSLPLTNTITSFVKSIFDDIWNETEQKKLKSQTYVWGAIVASFFYYVWISISILFILILFETNGYEDFLNFFLQYFIFIFSLGFSLYLHKTVSINLHFFILFQEFSFVLLKFSYFINVFTKFGFSIFYTKFS